MQLININTFLLIADFNLSYFLCALWCFSLPTFPFELFPSLSATDNRPHKWWLLALKFNRLLHVNITASIKNNKKYIIKFIKQNKNKLYIVYYYSELSSKIDSILSSTSSRSSTTSAASP